MPPINTLDYARPPKRRQLGALVPLFCLLIAVPLLFYIVVPSQPAHTHPAMREAAQADFANLQRALNSFHTDTSRYPTTAEGLDALLTNPSLPSWKGPYLKKIPNDPWGNPYRYLSPTTPPDPLHPYSLSSDGKDQRPNTPDDIQPP